MKRTNDSSIIPDVVNKSLETGFSLVPNHIGRSPELSGKAFKLLFILTSNKEGWKNYRENLYKMMQEGYNAIDSGLQELQELDFLRKIRYRQIDNKQMAGSFWVVTFTPGKYANLNKQKELLKEQGLEVFPPDDYPVETQGDGNHVEGFQEDGNQRLRILIKEDQLKNKDDSTVSRENSSPNGSSDKPSPEQRNKKYLPLAKHLAKTVQQEKNYNITTERLKGWSNDFRLLHEQDKVHPNRMKPVLSWYRKNIGGEYIPVVHSGASFRDKFLRLEDAIDRHKNSSKSNGQIKTTYRRQDDYEYPDKEIELE